MKYNLFIALVLSAALQLFSAEVELPGGWKAKHSGNFSISCSGNKINVKVLKRGTPLNITKEIKFPELFSFLFRKRMAQAKKGLLFREHTVQE